MPLAGYLHDVYVGTVSLFFLLPMMHSFLSNGNFAVVFPYMAELWPAPLCASGFGIVYGTSNLGKFIGPAGLAVIAGASNYVSPAATLDAIVPAFNYFAAWYLLAVLAFLFMGIETRGRTIEELDAALARPAPVRAAARCRPPRSFAYPVWPCLLSPDHHLLHGRPGRGEALILMDDDILLPFDLPAAALK
jgi:MFS transporter, putative metabolite:H+ symporter